MTDGIDTDDLSLAPGIALDTLRDIQPATAREVTDHCPLKFGTARKALARLHDAGYVERRPDPRDARASLYELTAAVDT